MKRFILPTILFAALFLTDFAVNAQRGRVYRHYPVYRSRPMVSVGIGGFWGGYYGPRRVWAPVYRPRVGVNVGIVIPPPGSAVRGLPPGAEKVDINGITYYYRGDVYYRERRDGGFEIVETPVGATVSRTPAGARLQKIDGNYYYEKNGTFYQKQTDEDGRPYYVIVGKNGELNTGEAYPENEDEYQPRNNYNNDNRDMPVVRNGNDTETSNNGAYTVRPEVGDRFEQLPRNSKEVSVDGKKLFQSPTGIYYKEITEEGNTVYEVVKTK